MRSGRLGTQARDCTHSPQQSLKDHVSGRGAAPSARAPWAERATPGGLGSSGTSEISFSQQRAAEGL